MRPQITTIIALTCACACGVGDVDVPALSSTDSTSSTTALPAMTTTSDPDGLSSGDGTSSSSSSTCTGPIDSSSGEESTTGGGDGVAYGDCANHPGCVLPEEVCIFDGVRGVCSWQDCSDASDCPALELPGPIPESFAPAVVACVDVTGDGVGECILDCTEGLTAGCPEGMTSWVVNGQAICMWPILPAGGGQCPDDDLGMAFGEYLGNVVGAVDDHYPLCSFGGGEDVLLTWKAPFAGTFRFSTDGSSFDTVIALLDACGGTEIACGDNQVVTFGVVDHSMAAGETVVIVIDSHSGAIGSGDFVLTVAA